MNKKTSKFLESLYSHGLNAQDALITEMVRIKMTERERKRKDNQFGSARKEKEQIFNTMKQITETEFGFFPGDRDFFYDLYTLGIQIDSIEFIEEVLANHGDKANSILSPRYLINHISMVLQLLRPKRALITDADKFLLGLQKLLEANRETEFTVIADSKLMYYVLVNVCAEHRNVEVRQQSIYERLHFFDRFDFILSLPEFGKKKKQEQVTYAYVSEATEAIAVENLMKSLTDEGYLFVVAPATFTFSGHDFSGIRQFIQEKYHLESIYKLPEGLFRPWTNAKTYLLSVSKNRSKSTIIGNVEYNQDSLRITESKEIAVEVFRTYPDWRVDLLLDTSLVQMERFTTQRHAKFKLKDIADIFRGKSIRKNDLMPGNIHVINISTIDANGQLALHHTETIKEEERKVTRYILQTEDILITCRGTVNKIAIFKRYPNSQHIYIPSANIIAIRVKEDVEPEYIKIFLESPIGMKVIKSFQRGTTVMNINPNDIGEIEIPIVSRSEQKRIVASYTQEYQHYLEEMKKIELRWNYKKAEIHEIVTNSKLFYV